MGDKTVWRDIIQQKAKLKVLFTHHSTVQMNLEERLITTEEVRDIIANGKIIEKRLDDPRGKTFLYPKYFDLYLKIVFWGIILKLRRLQT